MSDVVLETIRAVITGLIFTYLWLIGKKEAIRGQKGWKFILAGFALILFGMLIDISDNFPALNRFVVIGDTGYEAVLEKVVGYQFGFLILAVGFLKWMPTVIELRKTQRALEKSNEEMEANIELRTLHLEALNEQLKREIAERMKAEDELKVFATTDWLTQAYNRAKFDEIIDGEMERAKRFKHPLSILIFDIDNFKKINDTFGHSFGDYVLKATAGIVREHMRKVNHFIRWGGEEFIIIAIETDLKGAEILAERIRKATEDCSFNEKGRITLSFGVTQFKSDDTVDSFIKRADDALYKAKTKGKNCVETLTETPEHLSDIVNRL